MTTTQQFPRQCLAIIEGQRDENGFIPSLIVENEPGHFPMTGRGPLAAPWHFGKTYEDALAVCNNYNARNYGLSAADCLEILHSSMFAKLADKVSEPRPVYVRRDSGRYRQLNADELHEIALDYSLPVKRDNREPIRSPSDTERFLQLKLGHLEHEVFAVIYLDNRHRIIHFAELFRGTIDGTSVYPREVVKDALRLNAAALILAHNHPSGVAEPSQADERITKRIKAALELVDIRLLDHLIVGDRRSTSLASRGLL